METRVTLANCTDLDKVVYEEPEAVRHVLKPHSIMTVVEHRPNDEDPVTVFVFDDGVSLCGWEVEVKSGRDTTKQHVESGASQIRIYRPRETHSPITLVLQPSGEACSVQPGETVDVVLEPLDDAAPALDLRDSSIAFSGSIQHRAYEPGVANARGTL